MTVACCYASGHIAFLPEVPASLEALPICEGKDGAVRDFICGVARHSYDGKHLLVPGMPECGENQTAALAAMRRFTQWIGKNPPNGVRVFGGPKPRKRRTRKIPR